MEIRSIPPALTRRRSYARALRYALAGIAGVLVTIMLVWPEIGPSRGRLQLTTGKIDDKVDSDKDTALGAIFNGVDRYGRPFQVISKKAESTDPERSSLYLTAPIADMTMSDGRRVHLTAENGVYNPATKVVDLAGNVVFMDENGYRVDTSEASILLDEATVTGPKPVVGTASFGNVNGTGFRMTGGGDRVFVFGPARMNITSTAPQIK